MGFCFTVAKYIQHKIKSIEIMWQKQRGQLFQVTKIFADITPVLYQLSDLQKVPLKRKFYREELIKSPPPKSSDYFFVEKILKERKVKGKKQYLVKFLYYPHKFNQWLPEENVISNHNSKKLHKIIIK